MQNGGEGGGEKVNLLYLKHRFQLLLQVPYIGLLKNQTLLVVVLLDRYDTAPSF